MSMPAAVDRYYTRDEVLVLPDDGNRYELVYGELLVTPSPAVSHQLVVGRLFAALHAYVERHAVGRAFVSPADLSWGREDIIVQPDIFVLSPGDVREDRWERLRHFELFVEVLSPSTARYDRFTKRRLYQEMRVPLYWVIDIGRRRAEVWTPEATMPMYEEERVRWEPAGAGEGEGFVMELAELFRA
jgi:Uma2 family endonuclease